VKCAIVIRRAKWRNGEIRDGEVIRRMVDIGGLQNKAEFAKTDESAKSSVTSSIENTERARSMASEFYLTYSGFLARTLVVWGMSSTLCLTPRRQSGRRHSFSESTSEAVRPKISCKKDSLIDPDCDNSSPTKQAIESAGIDSEDEIKFLIIENQRLVRKLEDADREARHTAIHTRTVEEELRAEIKRLQEKQTDTDEEEDGKTQGLSNIEKLTGLLINGSIESVTSCSLPNGQEQLIVTGKMDEQNSDDGDELSTSAEADGEGFSIEEEFAHVCIDNEELRDQVRDLQEQLGRLIKAQVHSLTDELEVVQAESHNIRNQSFTLEALTAENAYLRHRVVTLETQQLDYQPEVSDPVADGLRKRSTQLESILEGLDHSSTASDDPTQCGFTDDVAHRLTEVERRCVQLEDCNDLMSACQAENEILREELEELRARLADETCTETVTLAQQRTDLEAEVSRLMAMKDDVAESLEEQVDYLQSTVESVSSERDELQVRVREQQKLIQTFERALQSEDLNDHTVLSVLSDCLSIVKTSQLESTRAYEELRLLHRQLHAVEDEKSELKEQLAKLRRQIRSMDD
jgi:hypothetical protein